MKHTKHTLGNLTLLVAALSQAGLAFAGFSGPGIVIDTTNALKNQCTNTAGANPFSYVSCTVNSFNTKKLNLTGTSTGGSSANGVGDAGISITGNADSISTINFSKTTATGSTYFPTSGIGGNGIDLSVTGSGFNLSTDSVSIVKGSGGSDGSNYGDAGLKGGAGVAGQVFGFSNGGVVTGGRGGAGYVGDFGGDSTNLGPDGLLGGTGGAGGVGVSGAGAGFSIVNTGTITGGSGYKGGDGGAGASNGNGGSGGSGGSGGAGVSGSSLTLTNMGKITGGSGGAGGVGGLGGAPGKNGADGAGGKGGVGVLAIGNSTITNSGTISGGLSFDGKTRADAIDLSGGGNKVVLQAGSILTGNVVSTSKSTNGGDTLALGGTVNATGGNNFSLSTVGGTAQFQGFQQFSKEGTSAWTLTDTGAGNWNVAAGTLTFADNMALTGAVTVASGGTLAANTSLVTGSVTNAGTLTTAAGKTLSITGDFTNTGTFRTTLTDTAVGKIAATGKVALGGNLFVDATQVTAANTFGGRVKGLITGNTLSGTFAQVDGNSALFKFTPVYSASGVDLSFGLVSGVADAIRATGGTYGQSIGAAQALDTIISADLGGNIAALFIPLTTQQQVADAGRETTPSLTSNNIAATEAILETINTIIQNRLAANRGQSTGDSFLGNKYAWIKPFGSHARQGTRDNVEGYKANTNGLAIGIDGTTSPMMRVGGAFVYAKSDLNGTSSIAPQSAGINVYQLIGYGTLNLDSTTDMDVQVDIGRNQNSGRRAIAFAGSTANASYNSQTAHAGVAVGRTLVIDAQTSMTPSVRADYTVIRDNSYSETGAGPLNLNVSGRTAKTFVIGADSKIARQLNAQTTLTGNLGVGYDTINDRNALTATFAGAPGVAFATYGVKPSPFLVRAGLGVVYLASTGAEITGRYDAEHRTSFVNQTLSVKARWPF